MEEQEEVVMPQVMVKGLVMVLPIQEVEVEEVLGHKLVVLVEKELLY
jgi:hypothetical protein